MRKLSTKEMWDKVRRHPDKERVDRIFEAYKEVDRVAKEGGIESPFDLPQDLLSDVITSQIEAASINGCGCEENIKSYYQDVYEISKEMFGNATRWGLKALPRVVKYYLRVYTLGRSRAKERRCHISRPFIVCWGEKFVCYCDEHKH